MEQVVTDLVELDKKRYQVYLDEEFTFVLYKGEVRKYKIVVGKPLAQAAYQELVQEVLPKRAKLRAMNLLTKRPYTEKKLRQKLVEGKYPEDIIDIALAYVKSYGYIDDEAYARDYISYRYLHDVARDKYNKLSEVIKDKLFANSVENQNANIDERSFGGRKGEMANAILKQFALDNCMSKMARANHLNNEIYIHDLDSYALGLHNCLSIPLDVRPAQSVSTALQLVAVIFQIQSLSQFGGASATHLDWTLVPYVRKSFNKHYRIGLRYLVKSVPCDDFKHLQDESIDCDRYKAYDDVYNYALDMTIREIYQAVEGMYHNLNTLQSRSGNQLPFTSINYGTCTLHEGRLIIKALLDTSIKGIGKLHRTSVFPCGIFQIADGINKHKGEPNYDLFRLALKSTAKRLYPNYANVDWSVNKGYDINNPSTYVATMGKRKLQPM